MRPRSDLDYPFLKPLAFFEEFGGHLPLFEVFGGHFVAFVTFGGHLPLFKTFWRALFKAFGGQIYIWLLEGRGVSLPSLPLDARLKCKRTILAPSAQTIKFRTIFY